MSACVSFPRQVLLGCFKFAVRKRSNKLRLCQLLFWAAALLFTQPCQGGAGSFTETGDPLSPIDPHIITLLPDGKVFAAGYPAAAGQLYDPVTGTWAATASSPPGLYYKAGTVLPNGNVLAAGMDGGAVPMNPAAALYDRTTETWSQAGTRVKASGQPTLTVLQNGMVLVAGGFHFLFIGSPALSVSSAELDDPVTNSWRETSDMTTVHQYHSATLLQNGKVLVVDLFPGGPYAELYDPVTETWRATGAPRHFQQNQPLTVLPNGKVTHRKGRRFRGRVLTIRKLKRGQRLAACCKSVSFLPQHYCRMARCLSPEAPPVLPWANCLIRRVGLGLWRTT